MDRISEIIKAARIAKGVTIEEVAEATLLSPHIIRDIENGAFEHFVGDELYVKMYLKKIARYLDIDESIADDYYAITREIKKADLEKIEEKREETGAITFVDKVKNIQPQIKQPIKKSVYEDHYVLRYVKYAIVTVIVLAIIVILGYTLIFANINDSSFENTNNSETEVSEKLDEPVKDKKDDKKDTNKKDNSKTSSKITFTKNADGDFSFELPKNYKDETFKLKVDFTFATVVDLHVNGDSSSYESETFKRGVYSSQLGSLSAADTLKEDSECESVELEFNVNDFEYLEFSYSWNLGHRYYINGQQIPLEDSDHQGTKTNGKVRTFKLTMVK